MKNDPYEMRFVYPPGTNFRIKKTVARGAKGNLPVKITDHQGWAAVEFTSAQNTEVKWDVQFEPAPVYRFPVREPQNAWAEAAGVDGVDLHWNVQHQPAQGYQVSLDGKVIGYSSTQIFALRGLEAGREYTAEIKTVWQDGKLSEKSARLKFTPREVLPREMALSSLEPFSLTQGWRQPEMDRTFTGKGLSIKGRHYASGIGMPTNSEIEFEIGSGYETFSAFVGVDDEFNNNEGSVEFILEGDGRELWKSKPLTKADGAVPVNIDIKGVKMLKLKVRRPEGQNGRAHADWVDARLKMRE